MQEQQVEKIEQKKEYTTPTLTTHGDVQQVTQIIIDGSGVRPF